MQDRVPFEYAIIRLLPKVEREEFVNIGAILFCKRKKYLGIRYHLDSDRLRTFCTTVDIKLVKDYLSAWDLVCNGADTGGVIGSLDLPSRFRWLTASRSTIIQSSKTHPGICDDPKKELDLLLEKFVL